MKTKPDETKPAEGESTGVLMMRSQQGDQAAFDRLSEIYKSEGKPIGQFLSSFSRTMVVNKLKDRAASQNLLARAAVAQDLNSTTDQLTDVTDGPIEQLIIGRAALCAVDMNLADREFQYAAGNGGPIAPIEALDRRRERSQRMLLATLRTLASVRRTNRSVVRANVSAGT